MYNDGEVITMTGCAAEERRGQLVHQETAFGRWRGRPGEQHKWAGGDEKEKRMFYSARNPYPNWMESVREQHLDEAGGLEEGVHPEMRSAGQALERR